MRQTSVAYIIMEQLGISRYQALALIEMAKRGAFDKILDNNCFNNYERASIMLKALEEMGQALEGEEKDTNGNSGDKTISKTITRNSTCACGSGRRYKHCCGLSH